MSLRLAADRDRRCWSPRARLPTAPAATPRRGSCLDFA